MIDAGIVYGCEEMAVPLYVGKNLVYEHTDIQEVEHEDESDTRIYQYHEYQYNKDEYISLISSRQLKQEAEIDYIAMMSDIELPDSGV